MAGLTPGHAFLMDKPIQVWICSTPTHGEKENPE